MSCQGGEPQRPNVEIEYCTKCRWMLRASWTAQELLQTFESRLQRVSLVPSQISGTFRISVDGEVIFDRKQHGRFPEMKEVKQLLRNKAFPEISLGHSDSAVKSQQHQKADADAAAERCTDCQH